MILISHRGNINGRVVGFENNPDYIQDTLSMGYDVEIDVWFIEGVFWLGHDEPQYQTDYKFLLNEKLWCHAKNLDALFEMKKYAIHYFWHERDTITLTSKNYVWAYPREKAIKGSIVSLPELLNTDLEGCRGICSDFVAKYK